MKQIMILAIVIYLCLASQVLGSEKAVIGKDYLIQTSEAAVQRASALSGIDLVAGDGKSQPMYKSELVIYVDSTTPFLSEVLNGRTAWKVDIENVSLSDLIDTVEKKGTHPVDVSVMIDAENGKLLSIRTTVKNKSISKFVEIPDRRAVEQLNMYGEKYLGLGVSEPNINFIEALQTSIVSPRSADVIIGQYLELSFSGYKRMGSEPKQVWIIQMHNAVTPGSGNYWRSIIDAKSGKALIGINAPK